jgi:hypothetical protein
MTVSATAMADMVGLGGQFTSASGTGARWANGDRPMIQAGAPIWTVLLA